MRTAHPLTSTCRFCSHYAPQGRRGGMCQQLGCPVKGCWRACNFAHSPFQDDLTHPAYNSEVAQLEQSLALVDATHPQRSPSNLPSSFV